MAYTTTKEDALPLPPHQQEMISACKSGDLKALKQQFILHSIKKGSLGMTYLSAIQSSHSGPPPTTTLIAAAIENSQPAILKFLLTTHPSVSVQCSSIVTPALRHSNMTVFRLLATQTPGIVNWEHDDHITTTITQACEFASDELILWLLDHGADPDGGGIIFFPQALNMAIVKGRSMRVVKKLVEKGARVRWWEMQSCVREGREDVLRLFWESGRLADRKAVDDKCLVGCVESARE